MHYCFRVKKMVYGCDHEDCNKGNGRYGTKINGMRWCAIGKRHVYSCDHYECNRSR